MLWIDADLDFSLDNLVNNPWNFHWTDGVNYPIIGPNGQGAQVADTYPDLDGYPILYVHCPSSTEAIEFPTIGSFYDFFQEFKGTCASSWINAPVDASIIGQIENTSCGGGNIIFEIFNQGSEVLSTVTIEASHNGVLQETFNWEGNLNILSYETVVLSDFLITESGEWKIEIVTVNGQSDNVLNGNIELFDIDLSTSFTTPQFGIEIEQTAFLDEFESFCGMRWELVNSANEVVEFR